MFIRPEADLLVEAARTAVAPADLHAMVERFAAVALEATDASRASVFLLDRDTGSVELWAVRSHAPVEEAWQAALTLGPISLDEMPLRRELFETGAPFAVEDARSSDLVPDAWCDALDLGALVVAPLVAAGQSLGILVVDWPGAAQAIPQRVVDVVGAIAGSLAVAVQHASAIARQAERTAALQALMQATTVLSAGAGLEDLAERLTEPLARALGATGLSICLIDDEHRYRTIAAWNPPIPAQGFLVDVGGDQLATAVAQAWEHGLRPVVVAEDDVALVPASGSGAVVVLPLASAEAALLGFVLVTLDAREPTGPAVELAGALSTHLAAAVERARLREELALETERLRGLCALWGSGGEALEAFSAAVEDAIGPALGFTVVRVAVADESLRGLAFFDEPDTIERDLIEHWRGTGHRDVESLVGGEMAAPVLVGGDVVGVVRAQQRGGRLTTRQGELLAALATAFGQALEREAERRAAAARELDLAVAEERERVAARLHDTVGRLLYALNLHAGALRLAAADDVLAAEARRIESLARSGLAGLRTAVAALASMRPDGHGLIPSLQRLAAEYQEDHGVAVRLVVDGDEQPLPPQVEDVLFQVAQEALANVERHADARNITISLDLRGGEAVLSVRDDGLGFGRSRSPQGTGLGLRLAERALAPVGGTLELADRVPGVEVVARVPTRLDLAGVSW